MNLRIPILRYHSINDHINLSLSVRIDSFVKQMDYLYHKGFNVITLDEAFLLWKKKLKVVKPLVITFDDGYRDIYVNALPILRKYNFKATVFLTTNSIGSSKLKTDVGNIPIPCLSWDEIKEMQNYDISFGSHTLSHPFLTKMSEENMKKEIKEPKKIIEEKLGIKVITFSYPFGDFNERVKNVVRSSGYLIACAEHLSRRQKEDILSLQRITISRIDTMYTFKIKLSKLYKWVLAERISNLLRRRFRK
ncbi:MAG: hypothetical protein B5M53_09550 [Candidatus Cloacimonas sp. 4484_209]|nr:MAG: hypothetical protein B5M53_09550 [Candidatus Cloacimonas sp. 4484_209]